MAQLDKPSSTPAESTQPAEANDPRIRDAKRLVGTYKRDVHEDHLWTDLEINTAINDRLSKHEAVPLLQIYDFNADQMRAQATRLFEQASKENREPTPGEEHEIIAAQLRVTVLESLSGALDAYMDIMTQFDALKAQGMRPNPAEETVVFQHLELVTKAAQDRSRISGELFLLPKNPPAAQKAATDKQRALLQKGAVEADQRMLQLLAAEDPSVPGANADGLLPAFTLMLSMLRDDYNAKLKEYTDVINAEARARTEKANALLQQAFPGKKERDISTADAGAVLAEVQPGYTLKEYHDDLLILQNGQSKYTIVKARAKANVQQMAGLNANIGRYQIHRAELSSIRHHFDQAYTKGSKNKPFPGQTSEEAMNASRAFLAAQQQGSVASLERHLSLVDTGVLKVGVGEKMEKMWNENGRIWVSRIAGQIASLETAWIPDVPLVKDGGIARNATREYLESGLMDALEWPRDANGQPKAWKDLSPGEQASITEKQMSVEKAITAFRETGVLEKMQTSVSAAKMLISRTDLQAENFLAEGEIDRATLPKDVVTDQNIDELVKRYGAQKVYVMCFVQLEQNWSDYSSAYGTLLTDFHDAIGAHYDFSRMMKDFARKQLGIAGLLAGLGLAGWILMAVAGVGALTVLRYGTKKAVSMAWKTAKGGTKMAIEGAKKGTRMMTGGGKAASQTGKVVKPVADATEVVKPVLEVTQDTARTAKSVDAAAETYKTYEELSIAIKNAKGAKNNELLAKLLKNPLLEQAAKGGNTEAKALMRLVRWMKIGKSAVRALPYLATLVDVVLIGYNEAAIGDATKQRNIGMKQTLEAKRAVLVGEGAAGASLLLLTGPQIAIGLPALVGAGYYTNSVFDSVIDWEKTSGNWMTETPEELQDELQKIPYGHISAGHKAGLGDSRLYRVWKNIAWSGKAIEDADNERMEQVEKINQSVRQEILTAYFLKTMKVAPIEGESEEDLQERIATLVRDRLQFVRYETNGTFDMGIRGEAFYDLPHQYADLMTMRRSFKKKERPVISYEWNGQTKTLDLSPLDVVIQPKEEDDTRQKALYALLKQYRDEVLPQQEAIQELQQPEKEQE